MLKNVSLRRRSADGRPSWVLLGPDGQPIAVFSAYVHSLRNRATNTLNSYCRHLAEFLDYLIEAAVILRGQVTKANLSEAIEAYGDFLQLGCAAPNYIAREVAGRLLPTPNSSASLSPKMAAIRHFLSLSEDVRKEMREQATFNAAIMLPVDVDPLLPDLNQRRELLPAEILAMQANSVLAGVIAGGPRYIASVPLNSRVGAFSVDQNRAFPFARAMAFIDAMPTSRDRAFYALLAACGCRTHEALQLLVDDIDVIEGTVRLVDPASRIAHPSYQGLSTWQRAQLAWKGRTTPLTLLIEPFASKFFLSLREYFAEERIPHGNQQFVFQYLTGQKRGDPYFLSSAASRLDLFHRVCAAVDVHLPCGTAGHSFRHMYGTYVVNYFPRANGEYGLPVPMVQQLMGHACLKSTLVYARHDADLLKLEIQNANQVLFSMGGPKNIQELKLAALESQVVKLRRQIEMSGVTNGELEP